MPHGTSLQHMAEMGRRHIFQPTADILLCMHAVIDHDEKVNMSINPFREQSSKA